MDVKADVPDLRKDGPRVACTLPVMDLAARFDDAQKRVKQLSKTPSTDDLLELYALYKQATSGDVAGSRPGRLDPKGRAKYDA
jgi:acyl-CoA-binding protein